MSATLVNILNESNSKVFVGVECANTVKAPSHYIDIEPNRTKTIETVGNVSSSNLYVLDSNKNTVWRGTVPTGILLTYDGVNLYHNKTLIPDLLVPLDEIDNTSPFSSFSPFGRCSYLTLILIVVLIVAVLLFARYYR